MFNSTILCNANIHTFFRILKSFATTTTTIFTDCIIKAVMLRFGIATRLGSRLQATSTITRQRCHSLTCTIRTDAHRAVAIISGARLTARLAAIVIVIVANTVVGRFIIGRIRRDRLWNVYGHSGWFIGCCCGGGLRSRVCGGGGASR